MTPIYLAPRMFVWMVTKQGVPTFGGMVPLTSYVSQNENFGGSYTAQSLLGQIRGMKDTSGHWGNTRLDKLTRTYDLLAKGQGYYSDFGMVWSWMFKNLDQVRKLKVQTYSMAVPPGGTKKVKTPGKVLDLAKVFAPGRPFPAAMKELIDNKCFGWDCIGFVSQYLVTVGHLTAYPSWYPNDFIDVGGFKEIKSLNDISPLSVVVFGNGFHIVIVHSVDSISANPSTGYVTAKVKVCQSYAGGPQLTEGTLRQSANGGPIRQSGLIDNNATVRVGKHPDLVPTYYMGDPVPDFVPGVQF